MFLWQDVVCMPAANFRGPCAELFWPQRHGRTVKRILSLPLYAGPSCLIPSTIVVPAKLYNLSPPLDPAADGPK